jgi:hypothetical protein
MVVPPIGWLQDADHPGFLGERVSPPRSTRAIGRLPFNPPAVSRHYARDTGGAFDNQGSWNPRIRRFHHSRFFQFLFLFPHSVH